MTVKSEVEVEFEEDIKPDFNKIKEEPINFDDLNYAINQPILVKEESKPLNIFEKDKSKKKLKHSSKPSTSSRTFVKLFYFFNNLFFFRKTICFR